MGIQAKENAGTAMSQVPAKWVTQNSLMDPDATKNFMAWKDRPAHYIPVVPLSALRDWNRPE